MWLKRLYEKNDAGLVVFRNKDGQKLFKHLDNDANVTFIDSNSSPAVVKNPFGLTSLHQGKAAPVGFLSTVVGIQIKREPKNLNQRLSTTLIKDGQDQGWLTLNGELVTITDSISGKELLLKIVEIEGRYCCHCNEKLEDDPFGVLARKHIEENHDGETSPDKENSSGYICKNYVTTQVEK